MKKILLLFIALSIFSCGESQSTKEFLFNHPEIKFQINSTGKIYDKNTPVKVLQKLSCNKEVLTFFINDKTIEMLLSNKFRRIGKTKYMVKDTSGFWESGIVFQVMEEETKDISTQESTSEQKRL